MTTLLILEMNDNAWGRIIVAGVASFIIFGIVGIVRHIKYSKSEEGKLHKKIDKKKSALSQLSKYKNQKDFVNKDLIDRKKKELYGEIEDDIFRYKLNTNKEYIQLKELKKQGILDNEAFNEAVNNIKKSIDKIPEENNEIITLDNGENLEVKPYLKNTLKNSKLISNLNTYNEQVVRSGKNLYYISDNTIKNVYQERVYDNGLIFGQQRNIISYGDILLNPEQQFDNDIIDVLSFCKVRIKKNKVNQVYWVKKGKTINKKTIELYQKNKNKITLNDLVFIDSVKAKNGFHFANLYGSFKVIKTKNGKVS
ncbi:hypothetical protein [Algibacter sp. PT7-4]|uniref:hypothetical protein n=1 Tax=Algibacter ulvanivorans TaxID=3400999 RepID=UPI003AABC7FB